MNASAPRFVPQVLRIRVAAADPQRLVMLTRLVRELGHIVASAGEASIVLADGAESAGGLVVVRLGNGREPGEGKLPVDASSDQIDAALRAVAAGLKVTTADNEESSFRALEQEHTVLLTPREIEVLSAVSNGLANKEIARNLGISLHTVKFHLESLMRKLEASSRTEAVIKAMRLGLLEAFRV